MSAKLAERPGVLALTFPVDYWDYLGWADTFAKPEFAERQKAYVAKLAPARALYAAGGGRRPRPGRRAAKTEQGRQAGATTPARRRAIRPTSASSATGASMWAPARAPKGGGEVWLVRYDPREQDVAVKSGDNKGQTIAAEERGARGDAPGRLARPPDGLPPAGSPPRRG